MTLLACLRRVGEEICLDSKADFSSVLSVLVLKQYLDGPIRATQAAIDANEHRYAGDWLSLAHAVPI